MSTNAVTPTGLTIQTIADITAELIAGLQAIYGIDINVNPESPDGQLVNLYAQGKIDMLEFIQQVFNSFDPDQAVGTSLDLRCAINGVIRKPGTYTQLMVDVVVTSPVSLIGLDVTTNPFTVQDTTGNQYNLLNSVSLTVPGTYSLEFQASTVGAITPALNSLTVISTPTFGIASTNNPSNPINVGSLTETDVALRLRRQRSVTLPSKSWYEGLQASILQYGANDCRVYENDTNSTDSNGIPAHSIWTIIDDNNLLPTAPSLAKTIASEAYARIVYVRKNAGCGQKPHTTDGYTVPVLQPDGSYLEIELDIPTLVNLYVSLDAYQMPGGPILDPTSLKNQIYNYFQSGDGRYKIGQTADASEITRYLKGLNPLVAFNNEGVSQTNGSGYTYMIPCDNLFGRPTLQSRWTLGALSSSNILINGA